MNNIIKNTSIYQYLKLNSEIHSAKTILLITSIYNQGILRDEQTNNYFNHIQKSINTFQLDIQRRFCFKVITYYVQSFYPSTNDLVQCQNFMQRFGATNVIAVGGGAAINFANALKYKKGSILTLVPLTLGGILSSTSKYVLILDVGEGKLKLKSNTSFCQRVVLDKTLLAIPGWNINSEAKRTISTKIDLVSTCIVLEIDTMIRSPNLEFNSKLILSKGTPFLDVITNLSRYLSADSLAISIACTLVPKFFPRANFISFLASLLPGYVTTLTGTTRYNLDSLSSLDWSQVTKLSALGDRLPHSDHLVKYLYHRTSNSFNACDKIVRDIISHSLYR